MARRRFRRRIACSILPTRCGITTLRHVGPVPRRHPQGRARPRAHARSVERPHDCVHGVAAGAGDVRLRLFVRSSPTSISTSISGGSDIVSCFVLGNPNGPVWRGDIQAAGSGHGCSRVRRARPSAPTGESWRTRLRDGVSIACRSVSGTTLATRAIAATYFERFPGVWWHGDWIRATEHGGFVIAGRSDATLKPGGVRIGTAEIYRQVQQIPEVIESLAIGQDGRETNGSCCSFTSRPAHARRRSEAADLPIGFGHTPRLATCRRGSSRCRHPAKDAKRQARRARRAADRARPAGDESGSDWPIPRRWTTSATCRSSSRDAGGGVVGPARLSATRLWSTPGANNRWSVAASSWGRRARAMFVVPMANAQKSRVRYRIDDRAHIELRRMLRDIRPSALDRRRIPLSSSRRCVAVRHRHC